MNGVVCIPTAHRPEFLALCLEKIAAAPESDLLDIRIFLDTCTDDRFNEVDYCRNTYLPQAEIFRANKHIEVLSGTWNILTSLKLGFETGRPFVVLIEEDVMIFPEKFFQWHQEQHEREDYFVTCGRRHGRMPLDFYSNPGTCYRRDKLAFVIPHITDKYFRNPTEYLNKHFPDMIGMDGPLDDGLIRKVIRSLGGKVLCADPPVASHAGFHYYNKIEPYTIKGTIQERIQKLRELLPTLSRNDRYTADFEPF